MLRFFNLPSKKININKITQHPYIVNKKIILLILIVVLIALIAAYILINSSKALPEKNENQDKTGETDLQSNCCKECVSVHSTIPGHDTGDRCIIFKSGYSHLPYKLSEDCLNYFEDSPLTIANCIDLAT